MCKVTHSIYIYVTDVTLERKSYATKCAHKDTQFKVICEANKKIGGLSSKIARREVQYGDEYIWENHTCGNHSPF